MCDIYRIWKRQILILEQMKKVVNRRKIATLVLMTAMFLNPLGYDALFYMVLKATGDSYALTTGIFYLLSALLFGVYFYLLDINPAKWVKEYMINLRKRIKK